MTDVDDELMDSAIEIAKKGDPAPNPHVGCLIATVRNGEKHVIAEGFHQAAGEAHAEQLALARAGEAAVGATVYVTLEPCNHQGRTPPCVNALISSKVARVVIGCRDPNPTVTGGGIERLRAAGIEVTVGVRQEQCEDLIRPWSKFITLGQSFLSLKLALSLDGRIATKTGQSKWITSQESRAYGHELRAKHDAVMVGINTVLSDNPRLTVRAARGRNPIRIIVDSKLRIPLNRHVVASAAEVPTCILTTNQADAGHQLALEDLGINVIRLPATAEGRCDMKVALRELAKREVVSILCEGGAELAGTLLQAQLADAMHVFIAPLLLGPRGRACAVDWAGPDSIETAPRVLDPHWQLHGNDAHVSGYLAYTTPATSLEKGAPEAR